MEIGVGKVLVSRTEANSNGWNDTSVTVNWSCWDAASGVMSANVSQVVNTEGFDQSSTGTCEDNAGNTASDTRNGLSIDTTAPTLAPTVSPNPVFMNDPAAATPNATDALSGMFSFR